VALPSSGNPISLGQIQTELGGSNPIGTNEYYRGGAHVASTQTSVPTSGTIDLADFYGLSRITEITISSNTNSYDLSADLQNNRGWDGTSDVTVILNINSGVDMSGPLTVNLPAASTLTINNSGDIVGQGGGGGSAGGSTPTAGGPGGAGGHGISLTNVVAIINNLSGGRIGGGGGGQGGSGGATGGRANDDESGCHNSVSYAGANGASGEPTQVPFNGPSGGAGSWGQAGATGGSHHTSSFIVCGLVTGGGGAGGAAGKAIHVGANASRTYNDSGTTYGATS